MIFAGLLIYNDYTYIAIYYVVAWIQYERRLKKSLQNSFSQGRLYD